MVGSEGTLGFVTEATVGLVPLPAVKALVTLEFDDLLEALGATPEVLRHRPSAVEVMDAFILRHARGHATLDAMLRAIVAGDNPALLCVEFYDDHLDLLLPRLDAFERDLARARPGVRVRRLIEAAAQARVWHLREAALGLSMAMPGDAKALSFVEDTAVAPERLRDYIARFQELVARHGTVAGVYAHASVGCLHVRPVVNLKTAAGVAQFEGIARDVADLVLEFGGALSGEHGDGLVRGAFNEQMFGTTLYQAFRTVKRTFDPDGRFNPGRIVDTPAITSHLRYGPAYRTPEPPSHFDFGSGGFGRAVEACSGVGACRKTARGHDVPLVHGHARRGALDARTGQRAAPGDDRPARPARPRRPRPARGARPLPRVPRVQERVPGERGHGPHQERSAGRALGPARRAAQGEGLRPCAAAGPLGQPAGAAVQPDSRQPAGPRAGRADRGHRPPPGAAGLDPPHAVATGRGAAAGRASRAVLFADTFTEHVDPHIGEAALDVLQHAGIGARVVAAWLLRAPADLAGPARRRDARSAAPPWTPCTTPRRAARPSSSVEPSCLSAVREDLPALLRGPARERAETVARASVLFEAFLEEELAAGRASLALRPGRDRCCCIRTATSDRWGWPRPPRRCCAGFPARR